MILGLGTAPTAAVVNLTRPGSGLQVGDSFEVRISGPPNTPVSATGIHPNGDITTTPFGSTDASGNLVISGTEEAQHVGRWTVTWHIGDVDAPVMNFDVGPIATQIRDEITIPGTPWLWIGVAAVAAWFLFKGK